MFTEPPDKLPDESLGTYFKRKFGKMRAAGQGKQEPGWEAAHQNVAQQDGTTVADNDIGKTPEEFEDKKEG